MRLGGGTVEFERNHVSEFMAKDFFKHLLGRVEEHRREPDIPLGRPAVAEGRTEPSAK